MEVRSLWEPQMAAVVELCDTMAGDTSAHWALVWQNACPMAGKTEAAAARQPVEDLGLYRCSDSLGQTASVTVARGYSDGCTDLGCGRDHDSQISRVVGGSSDSPPVKTVQTSRHLDVYCARSHGLRGIVVIRGMHQW